jgi:hypothetical protein
VTATGAAEGSSTGEPIDVSPFLGISHAEHWGTPFGREVTNPGGVALANLEIRPDGTASMTMETCALPDGTREFAWTWEAPTAAIRRGRSTSTTAMVKSHRRASDRLRHGIVPPHSMIGGADRGVCQPVHRG